MPRHSFNNYYMCNIAPDNKFIKTDIFVKAKEPLSAAKKLFRLNKTLENIYVLEENTNKIYHYETKHFFKTKKDFQLKR